jgi:hypothetical protein
MFKKQCQAVRTSSRQQGFCCLYMWTYCITSSLTLWSGNIDIPPAMLLRTEFVSDVKSAAETWHSHYHRYSYFLTRAPTHSTTELVQTSSTFLHVMDFLIGSSKSSNPFRQDAKPKEYNCQGSKEQPKAIGVIRDTGDERSCRLLWVLKDQEDMRRKKVKNFKRAILVPTRNLLDSSSIL